jgi:hypothetical protein
MVVPIAMDHPVGPRPSRESNATFFVIHVGVWIQPTDCWIHPTANTRSMPPRDSPYGLQLLLSMYGVRSHGDLSHSYGMGLLMIPMSIWMLWAMEPLDHLLLVWGLLLLTSGLRSRMWCCCV